MLDPGFFLDVNSIFFISTLFLLFAVIFFIIKKTLFVKKDMVKILIGCIVLSLLSLLVSYKEFSGTGVVYGYGWPHYFYSYWTSFEKTDSINSFSPIYLLSNIFFYLTLLSFLIILFKKQK